MVVGHLNDRLCIYDIKTAQVYAVVRGDLFDSRTVADKHKARVIFK